MPTFQNDAIICNTTTTQAAVRAVSENHTPQAGPGVMGISDAVGVWGESNTWHGLAGISKSTTGGHGVYGKNTSGGTGVVGESDGWMGVYGKSKSTTGGAGVMGEGDPGPGIIGKSTKWIGVYGETSGIENGPAGVWGEHKGAGTGVKAISVGGPGLAAFSAGNEAVHAETKSPGTAAIAAYNLNPEGTGAAIFAKKDGNKGHAGFFVGNVWVGGELSVSKDIVLANADCAEDFDIADADGIEPGTVMVFGKEGALHRSQQAYDKRVAGVISGAGSYKPGIVLDKRPSENKRQPVALLGKVFCKVDATYAPIEVGDLLTTSSTAGHAMKAADQANAFGSVIGKALRPLHEGQGLIPILVSLQ
jgi:hypothetical protein